MRSGLHEIVSDQQAEEDHHDKHDEHVDLIQNDAQVNPGEDFDVTRNEQESEDVSDIRNALQQADHIEDAKRTDGKGDVPEGRNKHPEGNKDIGLGGEDMPQQQNVPVSNAESNSKHLGAKTAVHEDQLNTFSTLSSNSHSNSTQKRVPSFLMPTKSLLAPKLHDVYEDFPDSPASKRGIMMKTGSKVAQSKFDSIFLYDDKVKDDKESRDKLLFERKRKEQLQSIPSLFRPTESKLAVPQAKVEADTITKRGTMMQTASVQFTSKFALMVQNAQQMELDNANKTKKDPIPYEAFEDAILPANKGHVFDPKVPSKKSAVPHEVFSECIKIPLEERMQRASALAVQELPPRVMKPAVPLEAFIPSPAKPPPVVQDNKPIKSLKQLHHYTKKKIEAISRYNTSTPQRRLYNQTLQQASVSASALQGNSALTFGMTTITTELEVLRAKKLMQSSITTELNKSRHQMNRAKLQCAKGVESLQTFAGEASGLIRKLFNRYVATTQKAAERSAESYRHYITSLTKFDQLIGPSHIKDSQQKRLHLIVNQQTTIMCASLQSIEDISVTLEEIKELLHAQKNNQGEYNFYEANPVHFFPIYMQKFFSNPILSPSKIKLNTKKLPKKKKRVIKKKKQQANIDTSARNVDMGDISIFDFSDDDEDFATAHNVASPERAIVRDLFLDEGVSIMKRQSVVSRDTFTDQMCIRDQPAILRQEDRQLRETIQDALCFQEEVCNSRRCSIVSRQSFTDPIRSITSPNITRKRLTSEERICEQDVLNPMKNLTLQPLGVAGATQRVGCWEESTLHDLTPVLIQPARTGVIVYDSHSNDTKEMDNTDVKKEGVKEEKNKETEISPIVDNMSMPPTFLSEDPFMLGQYQTDEVGGMEKNEAEKEMGDDDDATKIKLKDPAFWAEIAAAASTPSWVKVLEDDGEVFYYNEATDESCWDRPAGFVTPPGSVSVSGHNTARSSNSAMKDEVVKEEEQGKEIDEEVQQTLDMQPHMTVVEEVQEKNEEVSKREDTQKDKLDITASTLKVDAAASTPSWVKVLEDDGEVFYYNEATDESCWDRPAGFVTPPGSVPVSGHNTARSEREEHPGGEKEDEQRKQEVKKVEVIEVVVQEEEKVEKIQEKNDKLLTEAELKITSLSGHTPPPASTPAPPISPSSSGDDQRKLSLPQIRNGDWIKVLPPDGSANAYWCNEITGEIRAELPPITEIVQAMFDITPQDTPESCRRKELVRQLTDQLDEELTKQKKSLQHASTEMLQKLSDNSESHGTVLDLLKFPLHKPPSEGRNKDKVNDKTNIDTCITIEIGTDKNKEIDQTKTENKDPIEIKGENPWVKVLEDDGEVFYYNATTDESCWDRPAGFVTPPGSVPVSGHNTARSEGDSSTVAQVRIGPWLQILGNDASGTYWIHEVTGDLKWETPDPEDEDEEHKDGEDTNTENCAETARRKELMQSLKAKSDADMISFKLELLKKNTPELEALSMMDAAVDILTALQRDLKTDNNGKSLDSGEDDYSVPISTTAQMTHAAAVSSTTSTNYKGLSSGADYFDTGPLQLTASKSGRGEF